MAETAPENLPEETPSENLPAEAPMEGVIVEVFDPREGCPPDHMRVPISQHWTNKADGKDYLPGDEVVVPINIARSLLAAGYLLADPNDAAQVQSIFGVVPA